MALQGFGVGGKGRRPIALARMTRNATHAYLIIYLRDKLMLGWKIFVHAWRQVTGNLWAAVRMSWPAALITGLLFVATYISVDRIDIPTSVVLVLLVFTMVIGFLWVIVSWHRFILLNEHQTTLMPKMHTAAMFSYFLNALGIAFVTILIVLLVVLVGGIIFGLFVAMATAIYEPLGAVMAFMASLGALVVFVMGSVLFYRFGAALVGSALGKELSLSDSFKATKGHTWNLFVMAIPTAIVGSIASFLTEGNLGGIGMVVGFAVQWFAFFLGASCLTTIYGYFIEKRGLV